MVQVWSMADAGLVSTFDLQTLVSSKGGGLALGSCNPPSTFLPLPLPLPTTLPPSALSFLSVPVSVSLQAALQWLSALRLATYLSSASSSRGSLPWCPNSTSTTVQCHTLRTTERAAFLQQLGRTHLMSTSLTLVLQATSKYLADLVRVLAPAYLI